MSRRSPSYRCRVACPDGQHAVYRRRLRLLLADRDGAQCFYCRTPADPLTLTFDHFIPASLYRCNDLLNLRLACEPCNVAKGDRLPWLIVWLLGSNVRLNTAPQLQEAA